MILNQVMNQSTEEQELACEGPEPVKKAHPWNNSIQHSL
jgi:hypothetical protein